MGGIQSGATTRGMTTAVLGIVLVVGMVLGPSGAAGNTTPLAGVVDLLVDVETTPVVAGAVFHYETAIRNRGTNVAEHVEAVFEIPAVGIDVDFGSQSCTVVGSTRVEPDGSAHEQPWTVTCDLGTLAPGTEKRVTFSGTAGSHGTWISVVSVSSDLTDARPNDNRAETPLYVLPDGPSFSPAFQQPSRSNPIGRATV